MSRKQPAALAIPNFAGSNRSRPIDSDHGAPTHFAMPLRHRTDLRRFQNYLDAGAAAEKQGGDPLPASLKRATGKLATRPVPGARAERRVETRPVEDDKNGRTYIRALHCLEVMHKRAVITRAECAAGMMLSEAFEATEVSGGVDLSAVRVDTSRGNTGRTEGRVDAGRRYADMMRLIPTGSRQACEHVCIKGLALRNGYSRDGHDMRVHLGQLRAGLAALADAYARGRIK